MARTTSPTKKQIELPKCSKHKKGNHLWKVDFHADGCHEYSWAYSCTCGSHLTRTSERDPDDMFVSFGLEDNCTRCKQISAGARPKRSTTFTDPKGEQRAL